jgi:hypothetical protein
MNEMSHEEILNGDHFAKINYDNATIDTRRLIKSSTIPLITTDLELSALARTPPGKDRVLSMAVAPRRTRALLLWATSTDVWALDRNGSSSITQLFNKLHTTTSYTMKNSFRWPINSGN